MHVSFALNTVDRSDPAYKAALGLANALSFGEANKRARELGVLEVWIRAAHCDGKLRLTASAHLGVENGTPKAKGARSIEVDDARRCVEISDVLRQSARHPFLLSSDTTRLPTFEPIGQDTLQLAGKGSAWTTVMYELSTN